MPGFTKAQAIDGDDGVDLDSLFAVVERVVPRLHGGMLVVQGIIGEVGVIVETRRADHKHGMRSTIGDERTRMLLGDVFFNQAVMFAKLVCMRRRRKQDEQNLG